MTVLAASTFEPHVGSTFRVVGVWTPENGPDAESAPDVPATDGDTTEPLDIAIRLKKVHDLPPAGPYDQFRLTFTGPSSQPLDQNAYIVEHEAVPFDCLFLVPSSDSDGTRTYEASFTVKPATTERTGS